MHYRARVWIWISRHRLRRSADGVRWNRLRRPVVEPQEDYESRGVEDPRVTLYRRRLLHGLHRLRPYRGGQEIAGGSVLP